MCKAGESWIAEFYFNGEAGSSEDAAERALGQEADLDSVPCSAADPLHDFWQVTEGSREVSSRAAEPPPASLWAAFFIFSHGTHHASLF